VNIPEGTLIAILIVLAIIYLIRHI